jgi:hypothetical protein
MATKANESAAMKRFGTSLGLMMQRTSIVGIESSGMNRSLHQGKVLNLRLRQERLPVPNHPLRWFQATRSYKAWSSTRERESRVRRWFSFPKVRTDTKIYFAAHRSDLDGSFSLQGIVPSCSSLFSIKTEAIAITQFVFAIERFRR